MNTQASKKRLLLAGIGFLVLILAFAAVYFFTRDMPSPGEKQIFITIVSYDQQEETLSFYTEEETLGGALLKEGLIEGESTSYGLYISTVKGVTANAAEEQWWKLMQNGEMLMSGADATMLSDGDQYELVFTVGF